MVSKLDERMDEQVVKMDAQTMKIDEQGLNINSIDCAIGFKDWSTFGKSKFNKKQ